MNFTLGLTARRQLEESVAHLTDKRGKPVSKTQVIENALEVYHHVLGLDGKVRA
jgi:hypothetical protein